MSRTPTVEQYLLAYEAFISTPGICHVVLSREDDGTKVLVGELDDNPSTSVTNAIETVAIAVSDRLLSGGTEFDLYEYVPKGLPEGRPTFYAIEWNGGRPFRWPTWTVVDPDRNRWLSRVRRYVHESPYRSSDVRGERLNSTDSPWPSLGEHATTHFSSSVGEELRNTVRIALASEGITARSAPDLILRSDPVPASIKIDLALGVNVAHHLRGLLNTPGEEGWKAVARALRRLPLNDIGADVDLIDERTGELIARYVLPPDESDRHRAIDSIANDLESPQDEKERWWLSRRSRWGTALEAAHQDDAPTGQ